ncbi:nitrous oxide reductase accessory protein NosL [Halorussus salilacus]|uniref:NosD domain-containing protein n=1 Tax=Halorussus salilacus TaxID=2953750 RepID=UPI0020A2286A|nr:NosD domain-containing protein [Halorussus salilacus]USZ69487.1 nitrous oxide reductase accessory protein NosL [Halorussus salilacus]
MNPRPVLAALFAFLLVSSAAFVVDAGERRPDPVPFDDTVTMGLTAAATVEADDRDVEIPRAEVFYTQYRYVVGYYGVTALVDELGRDGHDRQFGPPLATYVSDYARADLRLTDEGYLRVPDDPGSFVSWVPAEEAHFVVDSRARTPAGETVVPFSSRDAADDFAAEHGGEVVGWDGVRARSFDTSASTRESFRTEVDRQHDWADGRVADADRLADRPVSVVVGEDADTVEEAVAAAPPNTTVVVPPGTYDANLTVDKPLTLRGAGSATHLRGDANGSVVSATAPRVAITDLRISGVGDTLVDENVSTDRGDDWDYRVQLGYGYGDAGVELAGANGSLVRNVSVETPANGVVARWSQRAVVDNVSVEGSDEWQEGFMGVMVMRSRVVVQNSTFVDGRDGVYTHLADGLVVRDNEMLGRDGLRFGVHEMYTSDALVANNTVRGADTGVVVMTRPTGNLIVGNDARDNGVGVNVGGEASYVADNVVADNRYGLKAPSKVSLYERNVVARNEIGVRAASIIPTNRVVSNDFVDNDEDVSAYLGPLRVWTAEGRGNYWDDAPGVDADGDGTIDRSFHPSGPVDGRVGDVPGASTLAQSPAQAAIRTLQGLVPGLRPTGVVDEAPLAEPVRPDALAETNRTDEPANATPSERP